MNGIIFAVVGFAIGGVVIGTALSDRVSGCVAEYKAPCVIQQTWTGATVRPISTSTEKLKP